MSKYIVFDLETIFLADKKINKIIEIGILVIHDKKIINRYTRLINPNNKIDNFVQKLTSITNEELEQEPLFKDVYHEFLPLFKDHIIVAHQVELDMKTLNDELNLINEPALENKVIDTVELSKILLPEATSYKLTDLTAYLKFKFDQSKAHRAIIDAEITTELFLFLKEKFVNLPIDSLLHLKNLSHSLISDLDHFYKKLINLNDNNKNHYNYYLDLPYLKPLNFNKQKEKLINYDLFLTQVYKEEGLLSKVYQDYVFRKNQIRISEEIKQQFDEHNHALIEAPTGLGKSIGYLIPAIYEAVQTKERVVLSTHTTQLQSQLFWNDILKLKEVFPFKFNVQILQGKKNYIDIKRFYNFLKNKRNDTYPLIIFKAKLIVWLTETNTGLFSDLNIESNMEQYLFDIQTLKSSNPYSYYSFSFNKAYSADVVLINHALLIADINTDGLLVPPYKKLIVDEAHQFKNLIIENKNLLLSNVNFYPFLKYLLKKTELYELKLLQQELFELLNRLYKYSENEYESRQTYLYSSKNQSNDINDKVLEDLKTIIGYFNISINKLKNDKLLDEVIIEELINYRSNMTHIISNLENNLLVLVTLTKEKNIINWSIHSEINQSNDKLISEFYENKHTIIYMSATLTIRDSFNYMLNQLNLEKDTRTIQLPTPFNLSEQTELIVPTDFPSIKSEKQYLAALSELIYSVNKLINGGILTLFTSYKMLKQSFYLLEDILSDDITLLAQGVTHSNREQLIKTFKENQPAILLGTASFWEGIDIKGDLLKCLILSRLPFQQMNDPAFQIEVERIEDSNKNSFFEYALPEAVLKFRQGIGRLIRNEKDQGLIFVLDNRLLYANYKKFFTESIYPIETNQLDTKQIIEKVGNNNNLTL